MAEPQQPNPSDPSWHRADGTPKGGGFLGVLTRPDGKVSSEISIGVNIDGKEIEIPTMVPTLSRDEVQWLLTNDISDPKRLPPAIVQKAIDFAKTRLSAGQSPFAQPNETPMAETEPLSASELKELSALPPEQLSEVWGKLSSEEQTTLRKLSPTYIPPAPSGSGGVVDELKRYGTELITGEGPARGQVKDYAIRELKGITHGMDPRTAIPAAIRLVTHPLSPESQVKRPITDPLSYVGAVAEDAGRGAVDLGKRVLSGDPEAVGNALAIPATDLAFEGLNRTGTALATSPKIQHAADMAAGSIVGAAGAKSVGLTPFIGGFLGRNLIKDSGIPAKVGEGIEKITGGRRAGDAPVSTGARVGAALSDDEVKALKKSGYTEEQIARLQQVAPPPGGTARVEGPVQAMRIPAPMASHTPVGPRTLQDLRQAELSKMENRPPGTAVNHDTGQIEPIQPVPSHEPPPAPVVPSTGVLPENLERTNFMEAISKGVEPAPRPEQIGVERVPPSKSKRTPRAPLPEKLGELGLRQSPLTQNDLKALIEAKMLTPEMAKMPITKLPPEAMEVIKRDRARRAGSYKTEAELDAIARHQGGE